MGEFGIGCGFGFDGNGLDCFRVIDGFFGVGDVGEFKGEKKGC